MRLRFPWGDLVRSYSYYLGFLVTMLRFTVRTSRHRIIYILMCFVALRASLAGSNTTNPVTTGADSISRTLPWLYTSSATGDAEGDFCKICWNNFKWSGFKDEYGNLSHFFHATRPKQNPHLQEEFLESRGERVMVASVSKCLLG
jgi:hypothetical protein